MKKFLGLLSLILLLPSAALAADTVVTSTPFDRDAITVTVYSGYTGHINETRLVRVPRGIGTMVVEGIPYLLDPATVIIESPGSEGAFTVKEQDYSNDLITYENLMDRYVGKPVKLVEWNRFKDRVETIGATLVSNNNGPVYKINDELHLGHSGRVVLPKLPEGLTTRSKLSWLYNNKDEGEGVRVLDISYLTGGLSWNADYSVVLGPGDDEARLSCWGTVTNTSGIDFKDATLRLMAGELSRAAPTGRPGMVYAKEMSSIGAPGADMAEEGVFEYHLYKMAGTTTLKNNHSKQIRLIDRKATGIVKEYTVRSDQAGLTGYLPSTGNTLPVETHVRIENSVDNGLGIALPAGKARLYTMDGERTRSYVGADRVAHTPRDGEIRIKAGDAFDIVATRIQTDYSRTTTRLHESEWLITIKNSKDEGISVGVLESLYGNWEILDSSHDYETLDSTTIRFDLTVPPHGETSLGYRVELGLR